MALDAHETEVLAHVLVNETPDEWYARVVATFGQEMADYHLAQKVNRHRDACLSAKAREGVSYKTAAEHTETARRTVLEMMGVTGGDLERAMEPATRLSSAVKK